MIFRVSLALVVGALLIGLLWHRSDPELEQVAVEAERQVSPASLQAREVRIEAAVHGFYGAPNAAARRSFVRRMAFVDGELWESFGDPLEIDEVGQLSQHDTTLTMVRVKFAGGSTSLLIEELPSGRFVVDSETANPEESRAWVRFREQKSQDPESFRVYATLSDYYNFEFQPSTHLALQLVFPGSEDVVIGYVRRNSQDADAILPGLRGQIASPMILSLRHPRDLADPSQVMIERWIQSDWIILDEATAPTFGERGLASG